MSGLFPAFHIVSSIQCHKIAIIILSIIYNHLLDVVRHSVNPFFQIVHCIRRNIGKRSICKRSYSLGHYRSCTIGFPGKRCQSQLNSSYAASVSQHSLRFPCKIPGLACQGLLIGLIHFIIGVKHICAKADRKCHYRCHYSCHSSHGILSVSVDQLIIGATDYCSCKPWKLNLFCSLLSYSVITGQRL